MPQLVLQGLADAITNTGNAFSARAKEERDRVARERDYQWREKQAQDARDAVTALQQGQQTFAKDERIARDTREDTLYKDRFNDQMIQQLKMEGYLAVDDQDNPEKVAEAQGRASKETQQGMDELAKLKVAAGHIMEVAKGTPTGVEKIFTMKVADLDKARALVESSFVKANEVTKKDQTDDDLNKTGGARLWAQNAIAKATISQERGVLQTEAGRLSRGAFNDAEWAAARAAAAADPLNAKIATSKDKGDQRALEAAARKIAEDKAMITVGQMKSQFQSLAEREKVTEDQDGTIAVLVHNKVAGAIDWAGVQRATNGAINMPDAPKTVANGMTFFDSQKNKGGPAASGVTSSGASATPAALADSPFTPYTNAGAEPAASMPGAAPFAFSNEDAAAARAASVANAPAPPPVVPAALAPPPPKEFGGGIGAFRKTLGVAQAIGGGIRDLGNDLYTGAPYVMANAVGGDKMLDLMKASQAKAAERDAVIKAEDDIIRNAPQSPEAIAIKKKRVTPGLFSAPTPTALLQ